MGFVADDHVVAVGSMPLPAAVSGSAGLGVGDGVEDGGGGGGPLEEPPPPQPIPQLT